MLPGKRLRSIYFERGSNCRLHAIEENENDGK